MPLCPCPLCRASMPKQIWPDNQVESATRVRQCVQLEPAAAAAVCVCVEIVSLCVCVCHNIIAAPPSITGASSAASRARATLIHHHHHHHHPSSSCSSSFVLMRSPGTRFKRPRESFSEMRIQARLLVTIEKQRKKARLPSHQEGLCSTDPRRRS